jgi:prepilin-type N-terminal cleavage/methylation domain-containing protein
VSTRVRRGFTILEAVVALAIVGLAGVSALEAVGGELRAAQRAADAYVTSALAQDRLAAVGLLASRDFAHLPDSLARGVFAPPFAAYRWTATAEPVSGERELYEVTVSIAGDRSTHALTTRMYRPVPVGVLR